MTLPVFLRKDDEHFAGMLTTKGEAARGAALMFTANNFLSHRPGSHWDIFTPQGWNGAYYSNIALGYWGPGAIDAYMADESEGLETVAHRRWVLFPPLKEVATGDVPETVGKYKYPAANALYVMDEFQVKGKGKAEKLMEKLVGKGAVDRAGLRAGERVEKAKFVAWPGDGYFPDPIVPERWSLSYPEADFSKAKVTVTNDFGEELDIDVVSRTKRDSRWGDATLVWEMYEKDLEGEGDRRFYVEVTGIQGKGPKAYRYRVILIDPARL